MAHGELGDFAAGKQVLRSSLKRAAQRDDKLVVATVQIYLALILAYHADPADAEEAHQHSQAILDASPSPIYSGMARTALSQLAFAQGRLDEAEAESRQATGLLLMFRPYAMAARVYRINALLGLGRVEEAQKVADEVLEDLQAIGCAGFCEVRARLSIAEARHAAGHMDAASRELQEAVRQLELRSTDIPDEAGKQRFLTAVPENARALALAQAWLHR
jgi:hypothetical protein